MRAIIKALLRYVMTRVGNDPTTYGLKVRTGGEQQPTQYGSERAHKAGSYYRVRTSAHNDRLQITAKSPTIGFQGRTSLSYRLHLEGGPAPVREPRYVAIPGVGMVEVER